MAFTLRAKLKFVQFGCPAELSFVARGEAGSGISLKISHEQFAYRGLFVYPFDCLCKKVCNA